MRGVGKFKYTRGKNSGGKKEEISDVRRDEGTMRNHVPKYSRGN